MVQPEYAQYIACDFYYRCKHMTYIISLFNMEYTNHNKGVQMK